jgi:phage-related protein (TIGR01555 family)
MQKVSVRAAVRDARTQEKKAQSALLQPGSASKTLDSFTNFAHKMGVGADNPLTTARYSFNPITRNRMQLEWMHRGTWIGGLAIDIVADDMTRAGVDFKSEVDPKDQQDIEGTSTVLGLWDKLGECIRWGRLYGGAVAVMLIDGQDLRTPLVEESVGPDQFKGLIVFDRHMVDPDLSDLVTELGPNLGQPKYYRVLDTAPALRGKVIHYSRIVLRHVGVELPYHQALTENLWGMSVLERLFDRLTMFDSASTGAGQLVYRAWLRTLKVKDLRQVIAAGNKPLEGLMQYVDVMRRYQNLEGISLLDAEDELDVQEHGAFSGLSDVVMMFAQQISGALQIPLVRLLGQSPAGLNSSGESDLRTYYDNINQQQNRLMHTGVNVLYRIVARSMGIDPGDDFGVDFASLRQMDNTERAAYAKQVTDAVNSAFGSGIISQFLALKELHQQAKLTGIFTNITKDDLAMAEAEITPPGAETEEAAERDSEQTEAARKHDAEQAELDRQHKIELQESAQQHQLRLAKETRNAAGSNRQAGKVAGGASKRVRL